METQVRCYYPDGSLHPLPASDDAIERWLDPEHSAIVSIDMHRGHVGPEEVLPCGAPRARDRIGAHNALHRAARDLGIPVIHVQHWQRYGGIDEVHSKAPNRRANWRVLFDMRGESNDVTEELNWEGTKWLDILVEEAPGDYYVRTKKRLSAFYPTDLEFLLRQLDVRNVVITGTLTDCCVINSAFDAANRDFRVIVPPDVSAGLSEEAERAAYSIISLHVGLLIDSPELVREWAARRGVAVPGGFQHARTADDAARATAQVG